MDQPGGPFKDFQKETTVTARNVRNAIKKLDELKEFFVKENVNFDRPLDNVLPARMILQKILDSIEDLDIIEFLTMEVS